MFLSTMALALSLVSLPSPLIENNDRVVVFGDSLTWQSHLTTTLETLHTSKHPTSHVKWFNRGYPGFTALVAAANYVPDAILMNPTLVIIEFGANDIGSSAWSIAAQNNYINGISSIVSQLRAWNPNVKIVTLSPPATEAKEWDKTTGRITAAQRNDSINKFAAALNTWDQSNNVGFVDISTPLNNIWVTTATQAWTWTSDGIHPTTEGSMPMSLLILRGLGETSGSSAASVSTGGGICSQNCTISNVAGDGVTTLTFDRLDTSLPFVIPANLQLKSTNLALGVSRAAVRYFPDWEVFNAWMIAVSGLTPGTWRLYEDNVGIGSFTDAQLASGVDMSVMPANTTFASVMGLQTASVMGRTIANNPPNGIWERVGDDANEINCLYNSGAFLNFTPAERLSALPGRDAFAASQDAVLDGWRTGYQSRAQPVLHHFKLTRP